ncbi:MAG TPA: hypothetical protein VEV42_02295, partial [Pyrinomonadaceae bacterium]|nr:hypothetical protein [Pyrinomonadaceae bacterium]
MARRSERPPAKSSKAKTDEKTSAKSNFIRAAATFDATVSTDKQDYLLGETVQISGSGFAPYDTVTLQVTHTDGTAEGGEGHEPWTTTADGNGSFSTTWYVNPDDSGGSAFLLTAVGGSGASAQTTFTDANPSADLDQFANLSGDPGDWVNGNLGSSKSIYHEGESIPYRLKFDNLPAGSHTVVIEWDTTKSDKHALDYLTSFDLSAPSADPCDNPIGASIPNCVTSGVAPFPIPPDPQVTGAGVTPIAGFFKMYGGTISGVSAYSYPLGSGFTGDKSARIAITFTPSVVNPVIAWGGHIATRLDWGNNNSAVAISGSPFHTRLISLDGSGGNQDRSLSADAVIFPSSITIIKDTVPDGPKDFGFTATGGLTPSTFTLDDDADPTNSNTQQYTNILVTAQNGNAYSITETAVTGWNLSFNSPPCTVTSPNGGSQSATATGVNITLTEGENVTCTFINTEDFNVTKGKIKIVKQTLPDGSSQSFSFSPNYESAFSLTDGQSNTSDFLVPTSEGGGTYSVSESSVTGWTSDGGVCDHSSTPGNITVVAGETTTCTFTNTQTPKLTVIKHVINDNGGTKVAADFTVNVTATNPSSSSFSGAESPGTTITLNSGSYSVDEGAHAGYDKSLSADCSGTIAPGDNKTCTITNNDQAAHLIVIKHVVNDNGGTKVAGDFTTTISGVSTANPSAPGAEAPGVDNTLTSVGSYSVDEGAHSGYDKTLSTDCSGTIALGETKTCTITNNDQAAHLIVIKHVINDNGGTATAANFTLDSGGTNDTPDDFAGAESPGTQVTLDAGSYNVTESGPAGYAASFSAYCSGTIANGQTKTCTVTNNDISPTLRVIKDLVPDNDTGHFNLTIDGTTAGTGANVGDGGTTGFVPVVAGNHTVGETAVTGTLLSDYDTVIGGDCAANGTVSLALAQNKTCTITNTKKGMAQVVKTVSGLPPAAGQTFTFEIRQGASVVSDGTVLETKTTDASGNLSFTTKLSAGATYQICEWVFPGWNTNLTGDGPLFVPNSIIPPALPNPNVNNLTVCANFSVQPGQTRTFTVNNTPPPGGRALTIGFWKNWASCASSNGKGQKPMLDLALGIASATTTNPPAGLVASAQNPGSLWPNYAAMWYLVLKGDPLSTINNIRPAPDCSKAENLLDKTTIDGKKKMSSDPLFNMTAQLVAAELNRFMGAGISGTTIMNVDRAVLLNGQYRFNGLTYSPKLTTADTNKANCL